MSELIPVPRAVANKQDLLTNIQTLVAEHLGVAVEYITLNSNFSDDLGLDWLDVVELIVVVEDQFPDLEILEAGSEVASLGDLIQHIHFIGDEASKEPSLDQKDWAALWAQRRMPTKEHADRNRCQNTRGTVSDEALRHRR
jgi:acyl carrier protein